jgi:uncharacterized glyoxalase superfamily protein PhnB
VIFLGPGMKAFGTSGPRDPAAAAMSLYVYVDDLDAHFARAQAEGARIRSPIGDAPGGKERIYTANDPQGHRWIFAQAK